MVRCVAVGTFKYFGFVCVVMATSNKCTLVVSDVVASQKNGYSAPLKGSMAIDGVDVSVTMKVSTDGVDLLELLGIANAGDMVDIVFVESSQQSLFVDE